jgi:hypothetical protein
MSTIAAYKAELVALLTTGITTVQVIYGPATGAAFAFYDTATAAVAVAVPTTPGVLLAQVTGEFELVEDDSPQSATQRNAAVVFSVHVESSI